ncbi:MAG: TadE/TadG family type IV pilus assembly protein [Bacillota bacterium]
MLRRLFSNESGSAVVLLAIVMTVLFGMAALAVDIGIVYHERQKMQYVLDAATLAGAQKLPDTLAATAKAIEFAELNGLTESEIEVSFLNNNRRLVVSSNRNQDLFFMRIFGFKSLSLNAVAAAESGSPGQAFDYTLFSGSSSKRLKLNGNNLLVNGSAHTNYNFQANGNSIQITGACEAVENITTNGNDISIPFRYPNSSYVDMLDYRQEVLAQAQAAGQVFENNVHYNGNNINVNNSIYVNGSVHFNGNTISGTGAILATGDIHINGNSINATTEDQVCIYSLGDIKINGNNITIDGILYAPHGSIEFNGNNITINGKVIGDNVRFNGNQISINGDSCTVISLPSEGVRLVL